MSDGKLAIIATVYNEELIIRQFLDHYTSQADAVFIIDNESTDRTPAIASSYGNVAVSSFSTGGTFIDSVQLSVKLRQKERCIGAFEYVALVDADEFLVAKDGQRLTAALSTLPPREVYGTQGFHIFKKPWEPPYDPRVPLVRQRQWGIEDPFYSKPVIIRSDSNATYSEGCHSFRDRDNAPLKERSATHFYLCHFAGIDEAAYVDRCMIRTRRLSAQNIARGHGHQYHHGSVQRFRKLFKAGSEATHATRLFLDDGTIVRNAMASGTA